MLKHRASHRKSEFQVTVSTVYTQTVHTYKTQTGKTVTIWQELGQHCGRVDLGEIFRMDTPVEIAEKMKSILVAPAIPETTTKPVLLLPAPKIAGLLTATIPSKNTTEATQATSASPEYVSMVDTFDKPKAIALPERMGKKAIAARFAVKELRRKAKYSRRRLATERQLNYLLDLPVNFLFNKVSVPEFRTFCWAITSAQPEDLSQAGVSALIDYVFRPEGLRLVTEVLAEYPRTGR